MRRRTIHTAIAMSFCALALTVTSASAAPPTILLSTFSAVTSHSVALESEINPAGKATTYRFEYGLADCSANPCTNIPIPDGKIPAGVIGVRVAASVEGLSPATTYHFRVQAKGESLVKGPDRTFTTYATSSGGLPDERAYEQASPVNKNGGDATGIFSVLKAAVQGGAVTFLSTSGVPGGCGAQELPLYVASRGAASWSTQGLLPCASFGQRTRVLGWTSDLSQVFTVATKLGNPQTDTLLERASADGSITTVVPPMPTGYSLVSANGAGAVFESPTKLPTVDAAIEGASNVYAWDKASGKLSLVSTLEDGTSPTKGAFAGPYDWVHGTTPTTLARGGAGREYYLQDGHAVSVDGSVFFTAAGTGQLYLRRNPTKEPLKAGKCADSALACTIHVSASQKTNGTGPGGMDAAGARPAAFMAASANGSKAFFTSSEKLTNDANTGIEPALPAIARANIDGSSSNLSFLPAAANAIAVDGEHVYWANPEAGAIGRAKLDGSEVKADFVGGANNPQGIAVDAGHIYWTNPGKDEPGEGAIGRAALDGTGVDQEFIEDAGNPRGIAADGEHLYWTNTALEDGSFGFVGRATLDGTTTVEPEFIKTFFNGTAPAAQLSGIAVDASHLYWIDSREFEPDNPLGWLSRANIDGSGYQPIFNSLSFNDDTSSRGIEVDASHIYWTNSAKSGIGRANIDGSGVQEEFIKDAAHPRGLAIDALHIYWSANQGAQPNPGNDLYRYEPATGKLSDLTIDKAHTNGADVKGVLGTSDDGAYVYYAANGVPEGAVNSPNAHGESAAPGNCKGDLEAMTGACNLYLWHEGQTSFIAMLDVGGGEPLTDAANWAPTPTGIFLGHLNFRKTGSVSPDGHTLLFRSQRQLDDYESAGTPELYLYRAGEAGPRCVSCNPTEAAPSGPPSLGVLLTTAMIPQRPAAVASRNLAAGGNRVFFESTDALVSSDTNGEAGCPTVGSQAQSFPACLDVYEWEAKSTGTCASESQNGGCLYLLSSGKSTWPSFFADASASGDEAFLFTREGLVGQDKDELLDVYDVKVRGGLASQNPPPSIFCESTEACHGPPSQAPAPEPSASATFVGPVNPTPKHSKKKQKKKKAHHKKKQHKAHASRKGQR